MNCVPALLELPTTSGAYTHVLKLRNRKLERLRLSAKLMGRLELGFELVPNRPQ